MIGARGPVGGAAVAALCGAGVPVLASSRRPADLALPRGAEAVALELDDATPLEPLLERCAALLLIPPGGPGSWQVTVTRRLAVAAASAGVERVALVSGMSAGHDPDSVSRSLERACGDAGLQPVCLRPNHFMQSYATHYRADVTAGRLRIYTGAGRASYIDARDVGRAAAGALLDPGQSGRAHVLTGPEALDQAAVARILSDVTGRAVRCAARSHEDTRATLRGLGLPAATVEVSVARLREIEQGRFEAVTDAVEQLGGAAPLGFEAWAREHAGAWR